jgi:pyridoxamine 5'-phosphate oxidase
MDIEHFRRNYNFTSLNLEDLKDNPFDQFRSWFDEAVKASIVEPNAMALATASINGKPSCRIVLMKKFDEAGLVYYTNLQSRKAREVKEMPFATATFFWKELERQVTIEGSVEEVDRKEVEQYFSTRPRGSQISTWASTQDQVISSRQILEDAYNTIEKRYQDQEIPLPDSWGGFRIKPNRFEFWQGRPDRLHDRFQYVQPIPSDRFQYVPGNSNISGWNIERLSP